MAATEHFQIPIPDEEDTVDQEFVRLQLAWAMVDLVLFQLSQGLAGKAPTGHQHAIADVLELGEALASKMPADTIFSLDDLADVEGAAGAAINYVLVKGSDGKFRPSSAAAAIGAHQHAASDIQGLVEQINAVVADLRDNAPAALDTLKELATALNNDPNFATTISAVIASKLPLAGGTLSGDLAITKAAPAVMLHYPNVKAGKWVMDAGGTLIWQDSGGQNHFYITAGGAVWTQQLGDLNSRIEGRAAAYANQCVQSTRSAGYVEYTHPTGNTTFQNSGYFITLTNRVGGDQYRFAGRQPQAYIPNVGWYAAFNF